jgi:hypothetical protein
MTGTTPLGQSVIFRSTDRAATWSSFPLPTDGTLGEFAYIAAVDPANPDILYVRTDLWKPNDDGVDEAADRLLYSNDGGENWRDVHSAGGKLFGFALSPDGGTVLIGYGDPVEGARVVNGDALGLYKSSTAGGTFGFTKILEGSVGCAAWTGTGVYVCTSQLNQPFELGFVASPDFDLGNSDPLEPLFQLTDITGPFACPACTSGAICESDWQYDCSTFSACTDGGGSAGAPPSGDCPDAAGGSGGSATGGAGASGGSGGAGASGGAPGSGGSSATGSGGSGTAAGGSGSGGSDDCGCRTPGSSEKPERLGLLGLCALAGAWFARRTLARSLRNRSRSSGASER